MSRCVVVLATVCVALGSASPVAPQGITTAAIRGSVRTSAGEGVDGAVARVVNVANGAASETRVRAGRFLVQGLAPGGPYRIVIRSVGYSPQLLDRLYLTLGEERDVAFTLFLLPAHLDTVNVTATGDRPLHSAGGIATSISDSALRRLPTLNRDMYDFVWLVPQAGTRFGLTGGGTSFRYNAYVIDGVSDRQLQGNNVMGSGTTGGKSIRFGLSERFTASMLSTRYNTR